MKNLQEYLSKYKVLFVEDEAVVREKTSLMLSQIFSSVDNACDGKEALEKYQLFYKTNQSNYDIVITDINMPNLDGISLSKEILKLNKSQQILIISAHNESDILENIINVGVSTYIHKPINFNNLMNVLEKISKIHELNKNEKNKRRKTLKLNNELNALIDGYDAMTIASRTDKNGIITYVSKGLEKVSGFSSDELIGHTHNVLRHPDMTKEVYSKMWKTIKSGKIFTGRIKNKTKDGGFFWTNTTVGAFLDNDGNILGYNAIREDITAQLEAKFLHRKVNLLLNNTSDGYLLFNKEFKINKGYSAKCLEIFNQKDIISLDIAQLLFSQDIEKYNLFNKGVKNIFSTSSKIKKDMFLSLLPTNIFIDKKSIKIIYKILNNNSIMMILKDISQEKILQSNLKKKRKQQSMIVQIVANIQNFINLKNSFKDIFDKIFISDNEVNIPKNHKKLLRELHTFKGLFSQFHLYHTPNSIHHLPQGPDL
jgi:PAS domain S-box-containing protein